MALIMLALGALLSVVGLYALVSGYPMIEIERGWATVIAGAVLLSGGLIVAALGIVVRTLTGLKAGLAAGAPALWPAPPHAEPPAHEPADVALPQPALPSTEQVLPAPAAVLAAGRDERLPIGLPRAADFDAFDTPQDERAEREPAQARTSAHEPEPEPEPVSFAWHDQGFSAFNLEPEAVPPPPPEPVPHPEEAHAPHEVPVADEVAVSEHRPEQPASHAAHVEEPPLDPHDAEPPIQHAPAIEPEPDLPEPDVPERAAPEPALAEHPDEAPSTAPEAPPNNLAVIGRYDSEGTSYVMYSDGSIEAQSESGVFRFGSMAELKAFIEG